MEWAYSRGCEALECSFVIPSLASVSATSFHVMFACALTLYRVVGRVLCMRELTISSKTVLSRWLLCSVGCFIWFLITY